MTRALRYASDRLPPKEAAFEAWELARKRSVPVAWETRDGTIIVRPTDMFIDIIRRHRRMMQAGAA